MLITKGINFVAAGEKEKINESMRDPHYFVNPDYSEQIKVEKNGKLKKASVDIVFI